MTDSSKARVGLERRAPTDISFVTYGQTGVIHHYIIMRASVGLCTTDDLNGRIYQIYVFVGAM